MNYFDYYLEAFRKYAVFDGRARRKEFWFFALFNLIVSLIIKSVEEPMGMTGMLSGVYVLATFIPVIALSVRRLHDTGRSGWWILINAIPVAGWIAYIIFAFTDSSAGENQYGPNPKGVTKPSEPATVQNN